MKSHSHEMNLNSQSYTFQFVYMALAINVTDGHGLRQVNAVFSVQFVVKAI